MSSQKAPALDGGWLSAKEAAAHLRIAPITLYRMLETGALRGVRIGRGKQWRISVSALKSFRLNGENGR